MKKTPLHSKHIDLNARMGAFGGWDMPIQYRGILQEHHHTRTVASIFDICHMGEFEIRGASASEDLERLLTLRIDSMKIGQCRYGFMLNEQGGVIDDLTCYRLGEDRFMLVVNAGTIEADATWIKEHISQTTIFEDRSAALSKLDVQGPKSSVLLEEVFGVQLPDLGFFRACELELLGTKVFLSRTGYTGELGYEIYMPTDHVAYFWNKLTSCSQIMPAGLGARDTLRLEMGYPLYGHELGLSRSPVATSRGAFIDRDKQFFGKDQVEVDLACPKDLLVGLLLPSKRAARAHDLVMSGDDVVGEVSSGSLAPSLDCAVAMAFVKRAYAKDGAMLDVEIRGLRHPVRVVKLPFYTEGTARIK